MTDIARLGIQVDSRPVDQAKAKLKTLETQAARTEQQTQRVGRGFSSLSNALRGPGIRNASLQLSQVAQQASATGNVVQALAIQLPDLTLGFGPLGIAAGVAAGALLPLAANMLGVGDKAEDTGERLDQFLSSLRQASEYAKLAITPISDLRAEFGNFADEVQRGAQIAAQASLAQAMRDYTAVSGDFGATLQGVTSSAQAYARSLENMEVVQRSLGERTISNASAFDDQQRSVDAARDAMRNAASDIGMTADEAVRLDIALRDLSGAEGMREVATQSSAVLDLFGEIYDEGQNIPPEVAAIITELQGVLEAASAGVTAFDDMASAASGAADQAARLAENMRVSAIGFSGDFMQLPGEGAAQAVQDQRIKQLRDAWRDANRPSRGGRRRGSGRRRGGGGVSEAERERQRMEQERDRILDGLKNAQDKYNDSVAQADRLMSAGILTQADYNRNLDQLGEELFQAEFGQVLSGIESFSDSMADAIVNAENLGDVFEQTLKRMAASFISSGIQDLLGGLFRGAVSGGGRGSFLGRIFAGFFDNGGNIPAGQFGIVGERGPEIVSGPAQVTSRADTAKAMGATYNTFNIDARGAVEGTAEQIRKAIEKAAPGIQRGATQNTLQYMRETQEGWA